jgi:hypothetical protein
MVYNSPEGIRVFDLATLKTRMLVTNSPAPTNADASPTFRFGRSAHAIVVGFSSEARPLPPLKQSTRARVLGKSA